MPVSKRYPCLFRRLTIVVLVIMQLTSLSAFSQRRGPFRRFRNRTRCATTRPPAPAPAWQPLFNGKDLAGWKKTNFGGEGEIAVKDGQIDMEFGYSLTGITYAKQDLPRTSYELRLEAMRVDGIDFFCGLTFPVEDSHCSFIVGGWAGTVVGLSNIDGKDASDNETTKYMNFKTKQWYRIKVRVTPERIQAWIDDQLVVNQSIVGRKIGLRNEVDPSVPLGICAWETKAALRNIQIRRLAP